MKRIIIILVVFCNSLSVFSQKVEFFSPTIEYAVREYLGVDSLFEITASQLDTISSLDLSCLGLVDIRDVSLLSNVKRLYLQCNVIEDVSPLLALDSLQYVDLSKNQLESINVLAFSHSPRMVVEVDFNHIFDFSCFQSLTLCHFTIGGSAMQSEKNVPFFRVCYLYGDGTDADAFVRCSVKTNVPDFTLLEYGESTIEIPKDGTDFNVSTNRKDACMVYLKRDDIVEDSTIVVPQQIIHLKASEVVTLKTGLPEHYQLKEITPAHHGTLRVVGKNFEYVASDSFESEKIYYSYYDNDVFKGISQFVLYSDMTDIVPTEMQDNNLKLVMNDSKIIHVLCNSSELTSQSVISVYDPSGRMLASKQVDSSNGIDTTLTINSSQSPILIVQVVSGRKKWVEKMLYNK